MKPDKNKKFVLAKKVAHKISFVGNLDEWSRAERITFDDGGVPPHGRRATVYTLWDEEYLYIAFDVERRNPKARILEHDGEGLWLDDGVEFLIDPLNDGGEFSMTDDVAYHINILNAVYDERGSGTRRPDASWTGAAIHEVRMKAAQGEDATGYICEIGVPWMELGISPTEDHTVIGIDFCVNGTEDETGNYHHFDWAGLRLFHHPDGFGKLKLVGSA
ncbi:MAG: carbohydrate-binding family 9-like protein [Bacteroidetes bacterium]|nr:carbohydrate-binding family 9-like protein [Bacteroidota bacterium]